MPVDGRGDIESVSAPAAGRAAEARKRSRENEHGRRKGRYDELLAEEVELGLEGDGPETRKARQFLLKFVFSARPDDAP